MVVRAARCYAGSMPTKHPRVFLTMSAETLKKADDLAEKWGLKRQEAIRKALKAAYAREFPEPSAATKKPRR